MGGRLVYCPKCRCGWMNHLKSSESSVPVCPPTTRGMDKPITPKSEAEPPQLKEYAIRYRTVKAVQWFKPGDHPRVYRQPEHGIDYLDMCDGDQTWVGPGDWIVEAAPDYVYVSENSHFQKDYVLADTHPTAKAKLPLSVLDHIHSILGYCGKIATEVGESRGLTGGLDGKDK